MDQFEARAIDDLFGRLAETARAAPPRDPEAERSIAERMARVPGSAYFLAQTAIVATHALEAAQRRIEALEAEPRGRSGGFLSGLLGGDRERERERELERERPLGRVPWGAPTGGMMGGGMFGGGGGFLAGAAQTAAGVAGGMLAANAISSMFSGGGGQFGGNDRDGLFGGGDERAGLLDGGSDDVAARDPIDVPWAHGGGGADDALMDEAGDVDARGFDAGGDDFG